MLRCFGNLFQLYIIIGEAKAWIVQKKEFREKTCICGKYLISIVLTKRTWKAEAHFIKKLIQYYFCCVTV